VRVSRLTLVDLAGSERLGKTGVRLGNTQMCTEGASHRWHTLLTCVREGRG
jgi:hypothetical protein